MEFLKTKKTRTGATLQEFDMPRHDEEPPWQIAIEIPRFRVRQQKFIDD
jgi:hypothetical protein